MIMIRDNCIEPMLHQKTAASVALQLELPRWNSRGKLQRRGPVSRLLVDMSQRNGRYVHPLHTRASCQMVRY
jgi:hypothetical protein